MLSEKEFITAIRENQQIIFKICHLYTDTTSNREDLFQEILFNAWKGIGNFKGHSKFSTWLYRVALNTSITFLKKDNKKGFIIPAEAAKQYLQDHSNVMDEQSVAMGRAIEDLSKIDKALVTLYLDNYSYHEIADIMGISVNNVAVKMNRIKIKLKENSKKYL